MVNLPVTPTPTKQPAASNVPPASKPTVAKPPASAAPKPGGKSEEELWLSSKVRDLRSNLEKDIKVVYQSLEELEEVHSVLMQQVIQRIEKKLGSGNVTQETYDLMDTEYYNMVYDNVEKLVAHISKGTETVIARISQTLKSGFDEILSSFKKA